MSYLRVEGNGSLIIFIREGLVALGLLRLCLRPAARQMIGGGGGLGRTSVRLYDRRIMIYTRVGMREE